ncbi:MAG: AAA family ATPase [Polyangiaceae bacterium]|nr:AAA family ATPase [Polyangiaceae bacterium]
MNMSAMRRRFNTAGPNDPARHYTLPAVARIPAVRRFVEEQLYFVVHAPRQVGKTTAFRALAHDLTTEGRFAALLVSLESGVPFANDVGAAEETVLDSWRASAEARLPADLQPPPWRNAKPGNRIRVALADWARDSQKPLVLFIDEVDSLEGPALVSILRQLREGYADRPESFPWSLALIGMRNVRDYKVTSDQVDRTHSASPFNIAAEAITLRDFSIEEVAALYNQHTIETGQVFENAAVNRVYKWTRGQPWLVNAVGRQLVEVLVSDPSKSITESHVDAAKALLIERQDTHLDSLAERLREPRVRKVIEPIFTGALLGDLPMDDRQFVLDLGLVGHTADGNVEIANPIYEEIIARVLLRRALDRPLKPRGSAKP